MPSLRSMAARLAAATICAALATTAAAQDRIFPYHIKGYPPVGDCHAVADQLGRDFQALTGVTSATGRCVEIRPSHFDIEIVYVAAAPLPLVTTEERGASGNGVYARLATCELAVAREKEHFESVTGVTAVVAYCQRLESSQGRPFLPRIEGFGEPTVRPFVAWTMLLDPPVTITVEDLEKKVEDNFRARGFDVRSVRVSQGFYGDTYVRYYAEEPIRVTSDEMARLPSRTACLEQLTNAEAMPHGQVLPPLALYCASGIAGTHYVKGIYQDLPTRTSLESAETFATYSDCQSNRAALVASYNTRMNGAVSGGLCTELMGDLGNQAEFKVRLFVR